MKTLPAAIGHLMGILRVNPAAIFFQPKGLKIGGFTNLPKRMILALKKNQKKLPDGQFCTMATCVRIWFGGPGH